MAEVYLASSAIAGFDCIETVRTAKETGFAGAQLYLNKSFEDPRYTQELIDVLGLAGIGFCIHLPNHPDKTSITAASAIAEEFNDAKMLMHYLPRRTMVEIPQARMGWENSITGVHDLTHIKMVQKLAKQQDRFFVFDYGRSLYSGFPTKQSRILRELNGVLSSLRPGVDMIHSADKTSWTKPFRETMCAVGPDIGVGRALFPALAQYRGVVVMEHENLGMALESKLAMGEWSSAK